MATSEASAKSAGKSAYFLMISTMRGRSAAVCSSISRAPIAQSKNCSWNLVGKQRHDLTTTIRFVVMGWPEVGGKFDCRSVLIVRTVE